MTGPQLSNAFFLQMFVILAVSRVIGTLARRFGQPRVAGEMIAGVLQNLAAVRATVAYAPASWSATALRRF